jgi:predicted GIY-YIG superfamily endonuclease
MLASKPRRTLHIGVTNDILGRTQRHRGGEGSHLTSRYGVGMLVYFFEEFADVNEAIQRGKSLKRSAAMEDQPDRAVQSAVGRPLPGQLVRHG